MGFPGGSDDKESACNAEPWVQSFGWEDPLEKRMATHSSILAWKFPWTEDPGRLYSPWGCKESDMTEWLTHKHIFWSLHSCFGLVFLDLMTSGS